MSKEAYIQYLSKHLETVTQLTALFTAEAQGELSAKSAEQEAAPMITAMKLYSNTNTGAASQGAMEAKLQDTSSTDNPVGTIMTLSRFWSQTPTKIIEITREEVASRSMAPH